LDLIFEDAFMSCEKRYLIFIGKLFRKWKASSKNNANTYVVRRQQLRASVWIFYLLTGMFLIADVDKPMPRMCRKLESRMS